MNLWIVVLSASMIRHQSMKAHGVGPVVAVGFGFDFCPILLWLWVDFEGREE